MLKQCPFCLAQLPERLTAEILAVDLSCSSGCDEQGLAEARCPSCRRAIWRKIIDLPYETGYLDYVEIRELSGEEEVASEEEKEQIDPLYPPALILNILEYARSGRPWSEAETARRIAYLLPRTPDDLIPKVVEEYQFWARLAGMGENASIPKEIQEALLRQGRLQMVKKVC